jgi:hypothetical protein
MATKISSGTYIGRNGASPKRKILSSRAQPADFTATDMKPVTLVGAPS